MPIRKIDHGSTGIYRRVTTRAEPFANGRPDGKACLAVFDEATKATIETVIAHVEREAKKLLSKYTGEIRSDDPPGSRVMEKCRSDVMPWVLPDPFPPNVTIQEEALARDAKQTMGEITALRHLMKTGDLPYAALSAFRLGRLFERMRVRPFESMVARDKKRKVGTKKGGQTRAETSAELQAEYRPMVKKLLSNKRFTSHRQISIEAAAAVNANHGDDVVTAETIRRNTRDILQGYPRQRRNQSKAK